MSWKWNATWLLLVALLPASYQISNPKSTSYVAAVVEFSPYYNADSSTLTFQGNTNIYLRHIKKASEENADIIVFPEDGLSTMSFPRREKMRQWTTVIPSPSDHYVPCTQTNVTVSETMKRLSCAAIKHKIYVVVNIAERTGGSGEIHYYNTNVVFDRTGKIIARYRKTHLFVEPNFDTPRKSDITTFDTDFGVTFGTFICFDILFHTPPLVLSRELGVKDFVYSTAWFSEVPFLTAVQTQFGWAYSENVNFLAAGYNRPEYGNTGSGIYLGRKGIAKAVMVGTGGDRLLISRVPKKRRESVRLSKKIRTTSFESLSEPVTRPEDAVNRINLLAQSLKEFTTHPVHDSISKKLCHRSFCCEFDVKVKHRDPKTKYRIAVFDGTRLFGRTVLAGTSVCGLVQCANDLVTSCGTNKVSDTTFSSIRIAGSFKNYTENLIMPSMLNSSLLPFNNFVYTDVVEGENLNVEVFSKMPIKNLATFSLFSRVFNRDGVHNPNHIPF